jgi:hypothetical protein
MASVRFPEAVTRVAAQRIASAVAEASASMNSLAMNLTDIAMLATRSVDAAVDRRAVDSAERLGAAARSALLNMQAHDRLVQELAAVCESLGTPMPGMPIRGAHAVDSDKERGSIELF